MCIHNLLLIELILEGFLLLQPSKKIEDAKLARDFQAVLQEFQKVQQLASERESTYSPSVPQSTQITMY